MTTTKFTKKKDTTPNITPLIMIDYEVLGDLLTLIRSEIVEIMVLGRVVKTTSKDNNIYTIDKLYIPPQTENSGAFVTTHDEKYHEWLYKMDREERLSMKMHLHTHPSMATNPSSIDEGMIKDRVENIDDFFIRIIANKALSFRVDLFELDQGLLHEEMIMYSTTPYFFVSLTKAGITLEEFENEALTKELKANMIPKTTVIEKSKYYSNYQAGFVWNSIKNKYTSKEDFAVDQRKAANVKNNEKSKRNTNHEVITPITNRTFSTKEDNLLEIAMKEELVETQKLYSDDYIIERFDLDDVTTVIDQLHILALGFLRDIEVIAMDDPIMPIDDVIKNYIFEFEEIAEYLGFTEIDTKQAIGGFYNAQYDKASRFFQSN